MHEQNGDRSLPGSKIFQMRDFFESLYEIIKFIFGASILWILMLGVFFLVVLILKSEEGFYLFLFFALVFVIGKIVNFMERKQRNIDNEDELTHTDENKTDNFPDDID